MPRRGQQRTHRRAQQHSFDRGIKTEKNVTRHTIINGRYIPSVVNLFFDFCNCIASGDFYVRAKRLRLSKITYLSVAWR